MPKQANRKYYTVISKSKEVYNNDEWQIQFGSYDRSDCVVEIEDFKRTDERLQERTQYKIITTNAGQSEVLAAIAKLNA